MHPEGKDSNDTTETPDLKQPEDAIKDLSPDEQEMENVQGGSALKYGIKGE